MDIATTLAGLKTGLEVSKSIAELVKQPLVDRNEVCNRLILIQQYILDSQAALNKAIEEQQELKGRLAAVEASKELEADLEWVADGGFFIRKSEKEKGAIPYCPVVFARTASPSP